MARLTFVVGKGGVGKTTVSCALALTLAARKPRESILLMSTDPAHSLADMLQTPLQSAPRRISKAKGRLSAWQVDSEKQFRRFLSSNREAILDIVESGTFFSREEIAPLLDTTLPGMAEVAGLLSIQELLEEKKYDHIVVDTAPFGHTLRLFELPAHFQKFLDFLNVASSRDALLAQRFGGRATLPAHPFLRRWELMVKQLKEAFSAGNAEIMLVTSPETFSLNEAVRSLESLSQSTPEMQVSTIVLNRVVEKAESCPRCHRRLQMKNRALRFLNQHFPRIPKLVGIDPGNPILGLTLLGRFGTSIFDRAKVRLESKPPSTRNLTLKQSDWPAASTSLSFTVGKGGVGKTTTTAALAFHTRNADRKMRVIVCSTDPAPSLDDIFQKPIGNKSVSVLGDHHFAAVEIDSVSEFRSWAARIHEQFNSELSMETGGLHVDLTFEKEVFSALLEIVPPGVDELFAIFRILDLLQAKSGKVLIDMAPTGHALELLRMPERILLWSRLLLKSLASHRTLAVAQDVAVELATLGQQVRKLIEIMKDPAQSRVWAVMLPEPVPDRQTRRLLQAVCEIGVEVDALFVNRVLVEQPKKVNCPQCKRERTWQWATVQELRKKYRQYKTYLAPEFPGEIAGAKALKKFTAKLWQIAE
jgi:arsenite-transporting ATPase